MRSKLVAMTATFTALSIASAYATSSIPNVSLMDLVVFTAGWVLGCKLGALVGALSWAVYGSINPYGFNPIIWAATMMAETLYGLAGGVARRMISGRSLRVKDALMLGCLGFMITFVYDLATNAVYALVFDVPLLLALAFGAPFAVLHEGGNFIIFSSVAPPLLRALSKVAEVSGGSRVA